MDDAFDQLLEISSYLFMYYICNMFHEWCDGYGDSAGYVGDEKATVETLDSEGWLKTGDLCYFDSDGFLYIVDRLKELIKYKAYQVMCYFPL